MISQNSGTDSITLCKHCGAACDEALVEFNSYSFCCSGCSIVYRLLAEDAVCEVLADSDVASQRFTRKGIPRFEYLEDETIVSALTSFRDGRVSHVSFRVPTIHCASCIWTLENIFRIDSSITRSEVNFLKKTVGLSFLHNEIRLREVVELLTRLGYEPDIKLSDAEGSHSTINHSIRSLYYKIGIAGFAFGNVMLFSAPDYLAQLSHDGAMLSPAFAKLFAVLSIVISLPVLLYCASDYFLNSVYSLREKKLSLDVPIALGLSALFLRSLFDITWGIGTGYLDSFCGLVFFLLIARLFQAKSFDTLSFERNYKSYFPLSVVIKRGSKTHTIPLSKLNEGDVLVVRQTELVPADAVLLSHHAHIDYSFVSGESEVVELLQGATVYAGGRVVGTSVELTVTKSVSHSYLTQLWNNNIFSKEKTSSLIDTSNAFARYFTATVLVIATGAALYWWPDSSKALNAFTAVLIVACPCALTLAAPFTFGATLAIFAKANLYLRNVSVVADMARLNCIVFDKTGTITESKAAKIEYSGSALSAIEKQWICTTARQSTHPLSEQITQYLSQSSDEKFCPSDLHSSIHHTEDFIEVPGKGVELKIEGHHILLGSADLVLPVCNEKLIPTDEYSQVFVAIDGEYKGFFRIALSLRRGVVNALQRLSKSFVLFLLSGDKNRQQDQLSSMFGVEKLLFNQSPQQKLEFVQALQSHGHVVAMIGDGINDAGALRQSNVGIALSERSTSFTPASDAIIGADALHRLPEFIEFAKLSVRVLIIAFAVSVVYNIIGLSLACSAKLNPMFAAVFMPLSSWSVVGIAYGLMRLYAKRITKEHDRE